MTAQFRLLPSDTAKRDQSFAMPVRHELVQAVIMFAHTMGGQGSRRTFRNKSLDVNLSCLERVRQSVGTDLGRPQGCPTTSEDSGVHCSHFGKIAALQLVGDGLRKDGYSCHVGALCRRSEEAKLHVTRL